MASLEGFYSYVANNKKATVKKKSSEKEYKKNGNASVDNFYRYVESGQAEKDRQSIQSYAQEYEYVPEYAKKFNDAKTEEQSRTAQRQNTTTDKKSNGGTVAVPKNTTYNKQAAKSFIDSNKQLEGVIAGESNTQYLQTLLQDEYKSGRMDEETANYLLNYYAKLPKAAKAQITEDKSTANKGYEAVKADYTYNGSLEPKGIGANSAKQTAAVADGKSNAASASMTQEEYLRRNPAATVADYNKYIADTRGINLSDVPKLTMTKEEYLRRNQGKTESDYNQYVAQSDNYDMSGMEDSEVLALSKSTDLKVADTAKREVTKRNAERSAQQADRDQYDYMFDGAYLYQTADESAKALLDSYAEAAYNDTLETQNAGAAAIAGGINGNSRNYNAKWFTRKQQAREKLKALGYSEDELNSALDYATRVYNAGQAEQLDMYIDTGTAVGDMLANASVNALVGFANPIGAVEYANSKITGKPVDPNSPWFNTSIAGEKSAETFKGKYDKEVDLPIFGKVDLYDEAYDQTYSIVQSQLAGFATPSLGIVSGIGEQATSKAARAIGRQVTKAINSFPTSMLTLGGQAGISAARNATAEGISTDKAIMTGIGAAVFEGAFEAFSLGEFADMVTKEAGKKTFKQFIANTMKSAITNEAVINASEETFTEIANIVWDYIVNGDNSEFGRLKTDYILDGYSTKDAEKKVFADLAAQSAEAGVGGFLQGAIMGGTAAAVNRTVSTGSNALSKTHIAKDYAMGSIIENTDTTGELNDYINAEADYVASDDGGAKVAKTKAKIEKKESKGKSATTLKGKIVRQTEEAIGAKTENTFFKGASSAEEINARYREFIEDNKDGKISDEDMDTIGRQWDSLSKYFTNLEATRARVGSIKTKAEERTDAKKGFNGFEQKGETVTLKNGSGETVSLKNAKFTNDAQKALYTAAVNTGNAETAQHMVDNYDADMEVSDYVKAYQAAMVAGRTMGIKTYSEMLENKNAFGNSSAKIAMLNSDTLQQALDDGFRTQTFGAGLTNLTTKRPTSSQYVQMMAFNQFSKTNGMAIVVTDTITADGRMRNGVQIGGTNALVIALDSEGNIARTVGHETYHYIKENNARYADSIKAVVLDALKRQGTDIDSLLAGYKKRGYSEAQPMDELIADSMFDVFDKRTITELITKGGADKTRSFLDHIGKAIAQMEEALKKFEQSHASTRDIAKLRNEIEAMNDVRDLFFEALDEIKSGENKAKEKGTATDTVSADYRKDNANLSTSLDAEYAELAKEPEKNKARLQEMVEQAAKAAGYKEVAFHGTESDAHFNKFRSPTFLSSDRKVARSYAKQGTDNVYNVYMNTDGFYEVNDIGASNRYISIPKELWEFVDYEFRPRYDEFTGKLKNAKAQTNVIADAARKAGYNGVVFRSIYDSGVNNREQKPSGMLGGIQMYETVELGQSDVYVAFYPSQIKSADPVTYDDSGNAIPLSERFNSENEDIRYSSKLSEAKDVDRLKKMSYNQYRTEKLSFEHSDLPFGTKRVFYNAKDKLFEMWEKGDDVIAILGKSKTLKEAERIYERVHRENDRTFYGNVDGIESTKGQDNWDSIVLGDRGNDDGNGRDVETKRTGNASGGSGANLLGSDSKESARYSTKLGDETIRSSGFYSEPTDAETVANDLRQQNSIENFIPKGFNFSDKFIKAIKSSGFHAPRLYRGMDADEFAFIKQNGYIKSNSSYNFGDQQGQTLFSDDPRYAMSYATSFAPRDIARKFYEGGAKSYMIEIANSVNLNTHMAEQLTNETFTYQEIPVGYVTRIIEFSYDKDSKTTTAKDIELDGMGSLVKDDPINGVPQFYRDSKTGTILYNVQERDSFEGSWFISEKYPDIRINYDRLETDSEYAAAMQFLLPAAGVTGRWIDIDPIDENGNVAYSTRLSEPTAADYAFLNEKRSRPTTQEKYKATLSQYKMLQKQIADAKKLFGADGEHIMSEKALDMFAKKVKKEAYTAMGLDEIKQRLQEIFDYAMFKGGDTEYGEFSETTLYNAVYDLATEMLNEAEITAAAKASEKGEEGLSTFLDNINSYNGKSVFIDDGIYKEINSGIGAFDNYADFKRNFKGINFTRNQKNKSAMPWTTFWTGVTNGCEYLFWQEGDTDNTENQPEILKTVYDAAISPVNPYTEGIMDIAESTDDIVMDIMNNFFSLPEMSVAEMIKKERSANNQALTQKDKQMIDLADRMERERRAAVSKARADERAYMREETERYIAKVKEKDKAREDKRADRLKKNNEERKKQFKKELNAAARKQYYTEKLLEESAAKLKRSEELREQAKTARSRAKMREQIGKQVKKITEMLVNPSDTKHIPTQLRSAVTDFCKIFSNDTSVFNSEKLLSLAYAYNKMKATEGEDEVRGYDESIAAEIEKLHETIGGERLAQLTLEETETVRNIVNNFYKIISDENKLFYSVRGETLVEAGEKANTEVGKIYHKRFKNLLTHGMLKPVYFFEALGNEELAQRYQNIRKGESEWFVKCRTARDKIASARDEFKYNEWGKNEFTVKLESTGEDITLTAEELMSLYATYRRGGEQGLHHIMEGGIVLEQASGTADKLKKRMWEQAQNDKKQVNKKPAAKLRAKLAGDFNYDIQSKAKQISYVELQELFGKMSEDMKGYADAIVGFMSNDVAAWGNKTSEALYGYKKFNEQNYFPIVCANNYIFFKLGGVTNDARLKNASFTKKTTPNAKNPIVLGNFTDTVGSHIDQMALYSSLTLAIEDFSRIWNYKDGSDSLRANLDTYYNGANRYIKTLLEDINGGVRVNTGEELSNKMMSMMKKNAVFANLSVAIQQPSAIARAMALIDQRYFYGNPTTGFKAAFQKAENNKSYQEMVKYAPVAGIKEMGLFDTSVGKSTVDWITGGITKTEAQQKKQMVEDAMSALPQRMDTVTWINIWEAVKREQTAKTELKGEELLKKCGERFTEVIDKTQVYDSVFSRSELMRSKSGLAKMLTAFGAEPAVNFNMAMNAALEMKAGNKTKAFRSMAAIIANVALNSVLKSIISALRDDDDDKTYAEKYLSNVVSNILFDPLSWVPYLNNAVNKMQGYDNGRIDLQPVEDIVNMMKTLFNDEKGTADKVHAVSYVIGEWTGVPVKNVSRDLNAFVIYPIKKAVTESTLEEKQQTTWHGVFNAIREELSLPGIKIDFRESDAERIYNDIINGDEADLARMQAKYKSKGKSIDSTVQTQLKENEPKVVEAAVALANGDTETYESILDELSATFGANTASDAIKYMQGQIQAAANADSNGDSEAKDGAIGNLTQSGYDRKAIDAAIAKTQPKQTSGETYDAVYNDSIAESAIASGNKTLIDKAYQEYIDKAEFNGKTHAEAVEYADGKMVSFAKAAYKNGDITWSEAEHYLEQYSDMDSDDIWFVQQELDYDGKDDYRKYIYFDEAFSDGNYSEMQRQGDLLIEHGTSEQSIRSAITTASKETYIELYRTDRAAADEMKQELIDLYIHFGQKGTKNQSARVKTSKNIDKWVQ